MSDNLVALQMNPAFMANYGHLEKTNLAQEKTESHQCAQCKTNLPPREWHRKVGWGDLSGNPLSNVLTKDVRSCLQCYEDWKDFLEATGEKGMDYGNLRNRVQGAIQAHRLDKDHPLARKYSLRVLRFEKKLKKHKEKDPQRELFA